MGKSLIQTVNQSPQTVAVNGVISPGTTIRRYGCNLRLSGNGIEVNGEGYYEIDGAVTVAPTAAGPVTVAILNDGAQIPGLIAEGTGTAGDNLTLPFVGTLRKGCCDGASTLTCVLLAGAGEVNNISLRVTKS